MRSSVHSAVSPWSSVHETTENLSTTSCRVSENNIFLAWIHRCLCKTDGALCSTCVYTGHVKGLGK